MLGAANSEGGGAVKRPATARATTGPRHFLDLDEVPAPELRRILDLAHAIKRAGRRMLRAAGVPLL